MNSFGRTNTESYEYVIFIVFAVLAAILGTVSLFVLQRLNILPVYLLPLLCFCMCFENTLLSFGSNISSNSKVAYAGYVFQSLEIPLFVIILHETSFRLYQSRSFQFCCVRFDQRNGKTAHHAAAVWLWSVRVIAVGLFVMNIFADFAFVPRRDDCQSADVSGYVSFVTDPKCKTLVLALVPPIFLSFISITIGLMLVRYLSPIIFYTVILIVKYIYTYRQLLNRHLQVWIQFNIASSQFTAMEDFIDLRAMPSCISDIQVGTSPSHYMAHR
jgi:hypothetical protein